MYGWILTVMLYSMARTLFSTNKLTVNGYESGLDHKYLQVLPAVAAVESPR